MRFYRRNIKGMWVTKSISAEESKAIKIKIINTGVNIFKAIQAINKKEDLNMPSSVIASIIDKAVPTYDSLATDVLELKELKKNIK